MSKLSEFLSEPPPGKTEEKDINRKAMIRLKLALLVKKIRVNKNPEVKSAFADHLEKVKGE